MSITFDSASQDGRWIAGHGSAEEFNLSNANAADLLRTLGYTDADDLYAGEATLDDMEGRVLVALAVAPESAERLAHEVTSDVLGGARMIECGRPAGYIQVRLDWMRTLIADARKNGATHISWC